MEEEYSQKLATNEQLQQTKYNIFSQHTEEWENGRIDKNEKWKKEHGKVKREKITELSYNTTMEGIIVQLNQALHQIIKRSTTHSLTEPSTLIYAARTLAANLSGIKRKEPPLKRQEPQWEMRIKTKNSYTTKKPVPTNWHCDGKTV